MHYAPLGLAWPVDWSGDGSVAAGTVARDVNHTNALFPASPAETLPGAEDWSRIQYNFRSSADSLDGVHQDTTAADEIDAVLSQALDAFPPPVADLYGEGVQNSDGCVPLMTFEGVPSASDPTPFLLRASDVTPHSRGLLVYSFGAGEYRLPRGTLRVQRPLSRSPFLDSGGSGACGGAYVFDMNAVIQALPNPAGLVGQQMFAQYLYVDRVGSAQRYGVTNAVRFTIQP